MPDAEPILRTADYVRSALQNEASGHDWWHIWRVWQVARRIGQAENADMLVVELAALLHDIADWKAHAGDSNIGSDTARRWLVSINTHEGIVEHVCGIVRDISFKGAGVVSPRLSLEGKVVQDADRLDAMGAIGIARAFAYGGAHGRLIHDPATKPEPHQTAEAYLNSTGSTINHFHEKLLLLQDRMNTATAHAIAATRHRFMQGFLQRFDEEWNGA